MRLSEGRPVFPQVPARRLADILQAHGLARNRVERATANLTIETWRRNSTLLESHRAVGGVVDTVEDAGLVNAGDDVGSTTSCAGATMSRATVMSRSPGK
jgi:hypothetical protein